ncbi:endonuclease I family protein [Oceanobacillus salinisoli]|uniref:endonuclease I family protein n=1 Tax=Oceanobacillus salinisoli TaxID=2678611 RepID=UPI0012E11CB5|nr:endonuclease [Oceanobacillus salinisoli]
MILTEQQRDKLLPVTTNRDRINSILLELKEKITDYQHDDRKYYDAEQDESAKKQYYNGIDFKKPKTLQSLQQLLKESHTNQVRYDPSEHVYPWVDLQPDGNLTSIYTGKDRNPQEVIEEDFIASLQRKEAIKNVTVKAGHHVTHSEMVQIENDFPYNCEHVVPQSWYNEKEPMRGDIHHLFTCDPVCNSYRSNYPYHDFPDYNPEEFQTNRIIASCGKAEDDLFEPEFGKGTAARAMLYFLVRYPEEIEHKHMEKVDKELLLHWHISFPPGLYEKHRNQAVFEIQGNRNPFIDFPEEMSRIFK